MDKQLFSLIVVFVAFAANLLLAMFSACILVKVLENRSRLSQRRSVLDVPLWKPIRRITLS